MARTGPSARSGSRSSAPSRERRSGRQPDQRAEAGTGKVAAARDRIVRSVLAPLNAVLLTRRHIEEVLDDAVERGRMTRSDAQEMAQTMPVKLTVVLPLFIIAVLLIGIGPAILSFSDLVSDLGGG